MADWLVKTEPGDYSFEDLLREKDKETVWTGVKNPVALKNLRAMKTGDRVIVYHTGDVKSAVGSATVSSFEEDPKNPSEPRVVLRAGKPLPRPVPLEEIRKSSLFSDSPLVRIGRLSVVPLTAAQYAFLTKG